MLKYNALIENIGVYDVVVVGGGVSGIGAAIEAARQGAKVAVIERNLTVGGMLTIGHVSPPMGKYEKFTMADELLKGIDYQSGSAKEHDTVEMASLLTRLLEENSVTTFLGCSVADVFKNEDIITQVIISTQFGLKAISGTIFIDCTGDGVLSYLAKEEIEYGRDDGLVQPMSIMFTIENVAPSSTLYCFHEEMDTPLKKGNFLQLCKKASKNGELPKSIDIVRLYRGLSDTERLVNATQINGLNPLDPTELGKAHKVLTGQIQQVVNFLKNNVEGFENIKIKKTSQCVGVRESRRVKCEYTLTSNDLLSGKKHKDVIVHNACFCLDIHNPSGAGQSEQQGRPKECLPYDIPYRSTLPKKTKNMFVAGRCIGGTHRAHSSYRVMNVCVNIGQAVGVASALCVKNGVLPHDLSPNEIQSVLTKKGINLFD